VRDDLACGQFAGEVSLLAQHPPPFQAVVHNSRMMGDQVDDGITAVIDDH
jgi:hypothetical protein